MKLEDIINKLQPVKTMIENSKIAPMINKAIDFWYSKVEGEDMHYVTHFLMGFFISTVFCLPLAVVAAVLKEVVDGLSGKGVCEIKAAVITIIGAIIAVFF